MVDRVDEPQTDKLARNWVLARGKSRTGLRANPPRNARCWAVANNIGQVGHADCAHRMPPAIDGASEALCLVSARGGPFAPTLCLSFFDWRAHTNPLVPKLDWAQGRIQQVILVSAVSACGDGDTRL